MPSNHIILKWLLPQDVPNPTSHFPPDTVGKVVNHVFLMILVHPEKGCWGVVPGPVRNQVWSLFAVVLSHTFFFFSTNKPCGKCRWWNAGTKQFNIKGSSKKDWLEAKSMTSQWEHDSLPFLPATSLTLSQNLEGIFDLTWCPSRALDSPHPLLPELQRYKDTVRCAELGAVVPGNCQIQLTQTLIVRLLKTHFLPPIFD